jgi:PAS domain S-box-containing protein
MDFRHYKPDVVWREIRRRMAVYHLDRSEAYAACLMDDPKEVETLYQKIIGSPGFFSDPEFFRTLKDKIFPEIIKKHGVDRPLRVWVPQCSTGEEAYSVAIAYIESIKILGEVPIQIIATDSNAKGIKRARAGIYPHRIANEVPPERLRRFFAKSEGGYQVKDLIRRFCYFATQNLLTDSPRSRVDLCIFRSPLNSLLPSSQKTAILALHDSLTPGGLLLLSSSPDVRTITGLLKLENKKHKIYSKIAVKRRTRQPKSRDSKASRQSRRNLSSTTYGPRPKAQQADARLKRLETIIAQQAADADKQQKTIEELQAFNETLARVNDQLQTVQEQLEANNDELQTRYEKAATISQLDFNQLKREREKLQVLVELSFEPIIVWDLEEGIVEWNKGCERLYGFTRAEAVGHNIHRLLRTVHPRPRTEFISGLLASGEWKGELHQTSKDGRRLIVESRQQTAEIGGRQIVLETSHDITEIKREQLNADFINKLDLAIAQIRDTDEIVRLATERLGEHLGADRCHLSEINRESDLSTVRENWEGWLQNVPSIVGEYPISDFITPELRAALEQGQSIIINDVKTDPRIRECASRYAAVRIGAALSVPVGSQGQWEATMTAIHKRPWTWSHDEAKLMRDIAIRVWLAVQQSRSLALLRESEAQARRTLAEQMVAGVAESDASGRYTMVNQRYCDITGRTWTELSRVRISEITHPEDWPSSAELYKRLFETGESFSIEKRYVRKDGSEAWVHTHVSPVRNAQGEIVESVAVVVDVTDRKRAEEQLRAAYERAEAATRAKDEFLTVVSHELRTPLVSILGYTQLLDGTPRDAALIRRVVEVIKRNSNLQLQLIEDLLDINRIISGKLKLEVGPVNLADVIHAALDVVRPAADAKGLQLRSTLDPLAAQITGDAARLQQVVWNLLSNSIKFTPKGGFVEVKLGRADRYVQIVVCDSGKGIDADLLPQLFYRFRQDDMSSTRRTGGLGLGLALVKDLVELHGGTVEAGSEGRDRGATFTVRLPVRAVYTPQTAQGETVQDLSHGHVKLPARTCVLVVDDEQDVRTLLKLTLESYGAEVQAVSSGKEVLEALATQLADRPFDVLICDIAMPDEDGYSVIRRVRALPSSKGGNIPAIALTAFGSLEYRNRGLQSGFQMYAVKPVRPDELVAMIQHLVKQFRLVS